MSFAISRIVVKSRALKHAVWLHAAEVGIGKWIVSINGDDYGLTPAGDIVDVLSFKTLAGYVVNVSEGTCTCDGFRFKGACKHLAAAFALFASREEMERMGLSLVEEPVTLGEEIQHAS